MINLGDEVKDKISCYVGIVTSKIEYITGCVQYYIQSENNKPSEKNFDEIRLEVTSVKKLKLKKTYKGNNQFNLGDNAVEIITRFNGIITGISYSITGIVGYLICPDDSNEEKNFDSYQTNSILLQKFSEKRITLKNDNKEIS